MNPPVVSLPTFSKLVRPVVPKGNRELSNVEKSALGTKVPLPPNESERLEALRQYDILDTDPEQNFDDITLLASHVCATPIAMISLVDESRQWFKSKIGMSKNETSRDIAFCAHGILQPEFFEVGDALADERFATNPQVTGDPRIRFYAGAPLVTSDGHALGMLCVNDQIPRELLPAQKAALQALSRQVVGQLELRKSLKELRRSDQRFRSFIEATSQIVWQSDAAGLVLEDLPSWRAYTGQTKEEILGNGWADSLHPEDRARMLELWADCTATGSPFEIEHRLRGADGIYRAFSVRGAPVLDDDGSVREWVGTHTDIAARKRAEEVLVESERRFRFLADLGDVTRTLSQPKEIMATVARLLGTYLAVSRCAYADVGKDGDRFTVPGDYIDGCASIVGDFQLTDFGWETHSKMAAGRTFVVRDVDAELGPKQGADAFNAMQIKAIIACPLIKDGKLHAMMAVHHLAPRQWTDSEIALVQEVVERCWSIIERARSELVVRENEEHLRLIIAATNDGIFEYDFPTASLTWSDRMYEMLGLDPHSFTPTMDSIIPLIHPDDRKIFQAAMRGQLAEGGRSETHLRILRHDGSYGNFLSRRSPVFDAAHHVIRSVGSLTDLTDLLQAEQKMVEQAELLNLAQDAIIVRDMDDRIEFWNHGAEVLYGWSAEEAQGRLSGDFLFREEPGTVLAKQRTLLETGAWSGECRHLTKQGATVTVRSRWTLVRDKHGRPKSKLIINTDVTEQKRIEEQFFRAQRIESIGTLASSVAHDLNNVLVPIMMAAPVLRGNIDSAERERFLDIVETSAQRGADIIKQVLTFARGADGDRILLQPIFLLEEVCKIASQTFPKSIVVRTCCQDDIHLLEANSTQLHQVLLNLCINARDAMPNGGELCLGAENIEVDEHYASKTPDAIAGPHVMLEITDSGSGIPSDVIAKIFDPFFTTKGVGQGTGLGLSTVAGIVKSHGGFINISSKPGRTSFKVFLPAQVVVDTSSALQADIIIPQGNGETILLVDDEPSIREVAEVILTSHGYKVIVAEDGPTALAIFARQMGHIGVVVTDLAMPGMDGLMLVGTLRRIEPGLKVIVSTGRTDDSHAAEITTLGVDGCLTKPYTCRNLLLKLSHVLQGSGQDTE